MGPLYRFGGFALDLATYELRAGIKVIKLERLPMDALIRLVTADGALVTREDLRAALWPGDVFIDEDAAINTVVRKIRRALGDDADAPRFVETVVGKGYRFLVPVKIAPEPAHAPALEQAEEAALRRSSEALPRAVAGAAASLLVAATVAAGVWTPGTSGPLGLRAAPNATPTDAGPKTQPALPAAYDAYVRGRYAWERRTEADLREAIRFFQASLDADPTYAPAYVGLSDSYAQLGYGSYIRPEDTFPLAREAARRAIALDPSLADAHAALGYALMYYDWDFARADEEFRRAIAVAPDAALAHQWRAYLLTATGRPFAEAFHEIAEARRLDPLSVAINTDSAYILHYYRRNAEAVAATRRALDMRPGFPLANFWLGRIYTEEGRYADARAALEHIGPLRTWTPAMAALGYLEARAGRPDAARRILAEFDALARSGRYASAYAIAVVHAGLGDRERAIALLREAVRERSHWLVWLGRDPRWDDLRADPRFGDLVRQVGLPAARE